MSVEYWETQSGIFALPANWYPAVVPGTADAAVFATGAKAAYSVLAGSLSADVLGSVLVASDTVDLVGTLALQELAIVDGATLSLKDFYLPSDSIVSPAVLVSGPVYIGHIDAPETVTGGSLYIDTPALLVDTSGLIDGNDGRTADVEVAGTWVNTQGLIITGAGADLLVAGGTLTVGPTGLLITSGATAQLDYLSPIGGVTIASGTLLSTVLPEYTPVADVPSLTVDGSGNLLGGYALTVGPVSDGTISGGVVADASAFVDLTGSGDFSGGVTIARGTLELGASNAAGSGAIVFAPSADATLRLDADVMPDNPIEGFTSGDTIDLSAIPYDPELAAIVSGGTVTLSQAGVIEARLTLAGNSTALPLLVSEDEGGGTALVPLTFAASGSSGSWTSVTEWSGQGATGFPGANDSVDIAAPGSYVISVTGTESA